MRNIVLVLGTIAVYLLLLIEWHMRSLSKRIDQAQRYLEQIIDLMRLRRPALRDGDDDTDADQDTIRKGTARIAPEPGDGA